MPSLLRDSLPQPALSITGSRSSSDPADPSRRLAGLVCRSVVASAAAAVFGRRARPGGETTARTLKEEPGEELVSLGDVVDTTLPPYVMSDDQSSNKRLKRGHEASGEDARDARNDALEHENEALRQQLSRSNAEVALLRQQLQRLQENHGALAAENFAVVNLSRLDTSLVTHIASFVGTSCELLNLALTCKSFGWQQPRSGLDWSLAEEAARHALSSGNNDTKVVRVSLSPYIRGTTTWLSILRESEYPLKFDTLLGRGMEHTNERRTSVRTGSRTGYVGTSSAFASNYVMESGIHYAEFHIVKGRPYIGIVRPMPNLDLARYASGGLCFFDRSFYDDFLAARTDEWGSGNVHACYYFVSSGRNYWTNWAGERQPELVWEGMEGCIVGDTLGMLLNLDKGTLTVYRNNRRLGVMKDELSGSYCWSVELPARGTSVVINRGHPPHPHGARE